MKQEIVNSLFCDGTENYVMPMEPEPYDTVTFRFRTGCGTADSVCLIIGDHTVTMQPLSSDGLFDYYEAKLKIGEEELSYFFEIFAEGERVLYDRLGVCRELKVRKPFKILPGFETPGWAKGAVMYQIFTDRFCNGDPDNDVLDGEYLYLGAPVKKVSDWNQLPAADDTREFYGGDLEGVLKKLDYLQDLGVEVIYLNPIFISPSNHKYDTQDYDTVDPHFGVIVADEGRLLTESDKDNRTATRYQCRIMDKRNLEASNAFFARLVKEIHRRGMRVILDGVFNHCGSFHRWMDREKIYNGKPGYENGAYLTGESPYRSYFSFLNENGWPDNDSYEGWWDYDTLPKLSYESAKALENYILKIGAKWVSPPYNADGWRLDVAADLGESSEYNHKFWKKFRTAVKNANPGAVIIAEHYGDASDWFGGDEWDTVMNYDAFMEPVSWFFTGMDKHSDLFRDELRGNTRAFQDSMTQAMSNFPVPSLQVAMNELSNHDHSRFLTRTNSRPGRIETSGSAAAEEGIRPELMRGAVLMQMTWPGAPTLYYGDEAGLCGFTDPDSRRTYPWGREDREMLSFHKEAIALHKRYPVLKDGSFCFLSAGEDRGVLSYARFSRESQLVMIFNIGNESKTLTVSVRQAGIADDRILTRVLCTDEAGFTEEKESYPVCDGKLTITMPAVSAVVMEARISPPIGE